jgi:hypothetical protein
VVRFTVVWSDDVQNDLIERWLTADSTERHWITELANLLDTVLQESPETRGVALATEPGLRVCKLPGVEPSAFVTFEVFPEDRTVRVTRLSFLRKS